MTGSNLVRLPNGRRVPRKRVFFSRDEFRLLLDVYSRRVATGEWKDYAVDSHGPVAVFSIFRHTFDSPLFSVTKRMNGKQCDYQVISGRETLKRGRTIREALSVFDRPMTLVTAGR